MSEAPKDPDKKPEQPDLFKKPDDKGSFSELFASKLTKKEQSRQELSMTQWMTGFIEQMENDVGADTPELDHLKEMLPMMQFAEQEQLNRERKFDTALDLLFKLVENTNTIIEELKKPKA